MTRKALRLALIVMVTLVLIRNVDAEPGDIKFTRKEAGTEDIAPAIFPHWVHRLQFKCHVCHDAIFVMKAGVNPITMDAIEKGTYCGVCHNGKTAFQATFEACTRCHRE
jgi:c(7)-type cytochrome triheme protein